MNTNNIEVAIAILEARVAELEARLPADRIGAWDDRYSGSAKEIEAHTLERCAQVAKSFMKYPAYYDAAERIAAAIIAQKDKP